MSHRFAQSPRPTTWGQVLFVSTLALIFLLVASAIGYTFYRQIKTWVANSDILPNFTIPNPTPMYVLDPSQPLPEWQGTERVNILVLGVDEREDQNGPWRTDTILLFSVDPLNKTAAMLSIPRDLWVPIPGYNEGRINTANYLGDAYGYPGGGPALAAETVRWNLGIPVDYTLRINFRAFVEAVNLIGGIDIYVEQEINDPLYPDSGYGYDPLYIPAGWVHMDGELALKYARTRHSPGGDFDRAERQQQVIRAILDKVTRYDMLPQIAPQALQLWNTISESVETNMTIDEMIRLANLATQIPPEKIRSAVIDENYTMPWETPDGQQVLVPVRERIRQLRDELFTAIPPVPPEQDPAALAAAEAATVMVQNGTLTAGLAQSTAEYLQQQQVNVINFGNADRNDYAASLIIHRDKPNSAAYIAQLLGLPATAITPASGTQEADVIVILGADYQPPTP